MQHRNDLAADVILGVISAAAAIAFGLLLKYFGGV